MQATGFGVHGDVQQLPAAVRTPPPTEHPTPPALLLLLLPGAALLNLRSATGTSELKTIHTYQIQKNK